jgi:hypothetical protein
MPGIRCGLPKGHAGAHVCVVEEPRLTAVWSDRNCKSCDVAAENLVDIPMQSTHRRIREKD